MLYSVIQRLIWDCCSITQRVHMNGEAKKTAEKKLADLGMAAIIEEHGLDKLGQDIYEHLMEKCVRHVPADKIKINLDGDD